MNVSQVAAERKLIGNLAGIAEADQPALRRTSPGLLIEVGAAGETRAIQRAPIHGHHMNAEDAEAVELVRGGSAIDVDLRNPAGLVEKNVAAFHLREAGRIPEHGAGIGGHGGVCTTKG